MNVDIAYRLSKLRRNRGLSQEALANQLGVSRQAISKWERAESSPDTDNLIALASLYGMSLDDLLKGDPEADDDEAAEKDDAATAEKDDAAAAEKDVACSEATSDATAEATDAAAGAAAEATSSPEADGDDAASDPTHVSFVDGIHVDDGGDHVHMNWRDGINVHDHAGADVHVGWDGIHVHDPEKGDHVDMGSGEGFRVSDHDGNEVHSDPAGGFTANGVHYDTLHEARRQLHHHHTWVHRFPYGWIALVAFICMGALGGMWREGLMVLFSTAIWSGIAGVADAFVGHRSPRKKRSAVTGLVGSVFLFCFLALGLLGGLWHPGWIIILVGIAICGIINAVWQVDDETDDTDVESEDSADE